MRVIPVSSQEREFVKTGEEMLVTAWKILNSPDWKVEKQLDNGDRVQVKQVNGKRVFKLTVSLNRKTGYKIQYIIPGLC